VSTPAQTPEPPYYAVIFTSRMTESVDGYDDASDQMLALASEQPGFLGYESARDENGLGITVSYWESEEAIANWRSNVEHRVVQSRGMKDWYSEFVTRVARVERARTFTRSDLPPRTR
jgi:heme-degrading monooxygenase HmoA